MTLEELHVVIDAQTKPFRDELAKMQKQLNTVSNDVTKHTSKIKSAVAGMVKAFLGLATLKALFNFGKQAINFASELQEVQNVVDVAFGEMSWKVERFAQNSIKQFGMSEASAKKTASTYMAMGKNMGIDPNQASDMAITLAGLTGDVASFYNISQELADTKLKSVFTGETETLKDLGIVMTQANLQSYALSQGISKNIKDMNQAELTTLRYNYVLQNLSMAQGDFARTGGSWANQVRMLKEQWAQLLSIIGNGLIAVFTPVIQVINTIIGKMIALAQVISGVFGRLFGKKNNDNAFTGVAESVGKSTDAVGGYSDAIDGVGSQAKKTAKEMEGALAGFDELNVIKTPSGSDSGGGSGSTGGGGGGFTTDPIDWDSAFPEPDTSGIDRAIDKVMRSLRKFEDFFDRHRVAIMSILAGLTAGLIAFFGYKWLAGIGGLTGLMVKILDIPGMRFLAEGFLNVFGGLSSSLDGIFGSITSTILGSKLFNTVKTIFSPLTGFMSSIFTTLVSQITLGWNAIAGIFTSSFTAIGGIVTSIIAKLMELPVIGTVLQKFAGVMSTLGTWLSSTFSGITKVLTIIASSPALIAGVVALVVAAITTLWMTSEEFRANVITAWENIQLVLQAVWENVIQPIFNGIILLAQTVWEGGLKPLWETWVEMVNVISSALLDLWNFIAPYVAEALEYLGPIFTTAFELLGVIVGTVINTIAGYINSVMLVITNCIEWIVSAIAGAKESFAQILDGIGQLFSGIIDFIVGVFTLDFDRAISGVVNIFSGLWNMLVGIVRGVWNTILGLFANGGKIFSGVVEGIANVFKNIVNTLITGINKVVSIPFNKINWLLNSIRAIDIPIIGQPFLGLWGANPLPVPQLPKLAQGCIANRATLGIFGEAGTEAILPLKHNTQGIEMIANKLLENMPVKQGDGTYLIQLVLEDGTVLAKKLIKNIKDYEIMTGKPAF